ncbi:MAG TPA: exodeoxyribonuclease VII small subunit [Nitrolancea sp.]|nr:exodeoxyribonuclease VII small subunit [Nitrolancea sp.]
MLTPRDNHEGSPDDPETTYEDLVAQLEEVVSRLETGGLPLEEAVAEYERGVELVRRCNDLLDHTELQIIDLSSDITRPSASTGNGGLRPAQLLFGNDDEEDE